MINEDDKTSTTYFMTQMTQKEFDEIKKYRIRSQDFETGLSREDRYILNMIRSKQIQKLEESSKADEKINSEIPK